MKESSDEEENEQRKTYSLEIKVNLTEEPLKIKRSVNFKNKMEDQDGTSESDGKITEEDDEALEYEEDEDDNDDDNEENAGESVEEEEDWSNFERDSDDYYYS